MWELTDAYEFTMIETVLAEGHADVPIVAEVFARGLTEDKGWFWGRDSIAKALRDFDPNVLIEYLTSLEETQGYNFERTKKKLKEEFNPEILALANGQEFAPHMPVVQVIAPFWQAILMETVICGIVNYETKIATQAKRFVNTTPKPICDMSARRTHPALSALHAEIAMAMGFATTSLLAAAPGPVTGTMSHAIPVLYEGLGLGEADGFKAHIEQMGASTLPVDGYSWENAVTDLVTWLPEDSAIRFDTGDLEVIVPEARRMMDEAGRTDIMIAVCGRLTPERIEELEAAGIPADSYGVGTKLVDSPSLCMVYKPIEIDGKPQAKKSGTKPVQAGRKYVFHTGKQIVSLPLKPSQHYQQLLTPITEDAKPVIAPIKVVGTGSNVGLFAGTFDPPHEGHAACINGILDDGAEVVLVSVTGNPWYKDPNPAQTRLEWAHTEFKDEDNHIRPRDRS